MNTPKILITGGTGFIGHHIVSHLLSCGAHCTLVIRNATKIPPLWSNHAQIRIVETGPLESATNLGHALSDVTTVVHLAGLAHMHHIDGNANPFERANTLATARLVRAAAKSNISAFIHLSSLAAITTNTTQAIINDTTCNTAPTPYGKAKREAEKHVVTLAETGIFAISLRPPLVVGAQAKGNWAALQRLAITGLPLPFACIDNRRSLISIDSLVAAVEQLCLKRWPVEKSGNYCIADEESLSLPRIVSELRQGMGMSPRLFRFPVAGLNALAKIINRQQMAAGLFGDLVVDASRFRNTFSFQQTRLLAAAITESGLHYRQLSSDGSGGIRA